MGQTQTASSKAETYTWGVEIECFLPQSKVQELGISVGSYHHSYLRAKLADSDPAIAGFNVGANADGAAGQTVMHAHIHLIPRRHGDTPDPRGGVRAVIAGKALY